MNITVKRIIKSVAFLTILALLLVSVSWFFAPKDVNSPTGYTKDAPYGFMSEQKDSIDVFFIGNSDAYAGFSPMELWNSYGYTSYICSLAKQSTTKSYEFCEQIFECQSPKLIVIETDCFYYETNDADDRNIIVEFLGETILPILKYHNRWKQTPLTQYLIKPNYNLTYFTKGQNIVRTPDPYEGDEFMKETDKMEPMTDKNIEYVNKIIELCRKNNADVLFVELPSATSWSYEKHNAVNKLAEDASIPFIDFHFIMDEIGFDWKTDTRDKGNHLSFKGSQKITSYLGKYFEDNYNLPDKRGDNNYSSWNDDYEKFKEFITRQ